MRTTRNRRAHGVLAVTVAMLAAGCGGGVSTAPTNPQASTVAGGTANTSAAASPGLPNPFTVIARYSAASLGLNQPANLAIGPDGNLYVTDAHQRVVVFSSHGKFLRQWGRPGSGPGQFSFILRHATASGVSAALAIGADGRVYVDDSGNARIEVFNRNGGFIRMFGSYGYGNSQWLFSQSVAVDADGNIYVADDVQETLSMFSSTGAFEWRIGGTSESDPDLSGHFHFSSSSIDSHGVLLMANDDQNRIVSVDATGRKVGAFGSPEDFKAGPCDVTADAAGYIFVNSCNEPLQAPHYTEVFDHNLNLVGTWYPSGLGYAPQFGPNGEIFTLGDDGSIIQLRLNLAGG